MTRWDAQRKIRVGILFSQTGSLAETECAHLQGAILGLESINEEGGIDGRPVEPLICDPASDLDQFRTLAHRMIVDGEVDNIFGCCTSPSRKAVQPVVERCNALLWYPTQFEGFEYSPNIVYGGACPNQHVLPLARYLMANSRERVFLLGNDYVFPRETNRVMRDVIESLGGEITGEVYVPLGAGQAALAPVMQYPALRASDVIFSTIVGFSNRALFETYRAANIDRQTTPIASISISEHEVAHYGAELLSGHLVALSYLESNTCSANLTFIERLKRRYGPCARGNQLMASSYVQIRLFAEAVNLCRTDVPQAVTEALSYVRLTGPLGPIEIDAESHYTYLQPIIARANGYGTFDIVQVAPGPVRPDPYMIAYR